MANATRTYRFQIECSTVHLLQSRAPPPTTDKQTTRKLRRTGVVRAHTQPNCRPADDPYRTCAMLCSRVISRLISFSKTEPEYVLLRLCHVLSVSESGAPGLQPNATRMRLRTRGVHTRKVVHPVFNAIHVQRARPRPSMAGPSTRALVTVQYRDGPDWSVGWLTRSRSSTVILTRIMLDWRHDEPVVPGQIRTHKNTLKYRI